MPVQRPCPKPKRKQLAVRNPADTPNHYRADISEAINHWRAERTRATDEVLPALSDLAMGILGQLETSWHPELNNAEIRRRAILNGLAISRLLRQQWTPGVILGDGIGAGTAETLSDMQSYDEFVLDHRVHTTPFAEEILTPTGWYRVGDLYIHQVRPADPTDQMRQFVLDRNVEVNFDSLETIFPYVVSRANPKG